jgi:4-hydroxy-3-methylbut-2-enyl diphosphate reductase
LCYATNENQDATYGLLESTSDLAIVVGGYNSSNTSHLVELLERKFPTYFISSEDEIMSINEIHHFNYHEQQKKVTQQFLPVKENVRIILTSGASCPDAEVEKVMNKLLSFFRNAKSTEEVLNQFK